MPGASSRTNGLQGPKSLTNIQYIDKNDEEAKKLRSRTYWRAVSRDHDLVTHQRAQAGNQQKKKKASQELNRPQHFTKEKYLQEVQVP
jgi:hypothetical protein